MSFKNLTWSEFKSDCEELIKISKSLDDSWDFYKKNDNDGNGFLIYKQKIAHSKNTTDTASCEKLELIQIEYHVVYSISYQVPVLCFQAFRDDGSMLDLEETWTIFRSYDDENPTRDRMLSILTQMDHPVLFKPFLAIHPCRTAELLGQTPESCNNVVTFISVMGPYVQLNLRNEYGLMLNKDSRLL